MRRALVRTGLCCLPLLVAARLAAPAAAQGQASPLLPPEHWAVEAVWRIEALGLVPGYLAAERSIPRAAAGEVLRAAAEEARTEDAPWADLAADWVARFEEEFPETAAFADGAGPRLLGSAAGVGYRHRRGAVSPGLGEFAPEVTGPAPLADLDEGWIAAEVAARVAAPLTLSATPRLGTEGAELRRWEADLAWRNWALVAGRGEVGYGVARGGGVLLSGEGAIDRLALVTARPFHFPGFLRRLGPVAFHTFVGLLPGDRHPGDPVLAGVRLSGRIHPRITLAGQRAALIGGSATGKPVTAEGLWKALIGQYGGIEDQIASVEARVHLPTEAFLPASLHCEWGAEDTAGGFTDVPGVLCGALLPSLPGLPAVAAGVERAYFGARCCDNPPWYRHKNFPGSWALEEETLGHPLGGEGSEWLGYLRGSALDARLRAEGRAFRRERSGENLFVPGREGDSFGLAGEAAWRFRPDSEVALAAFREAGEGWSEARLALVTRMRF